jgi:hypothetical protein
MERDARALASLVIQEQTRVRRESQRNRGCRFVIYAGLKEFNLIRSADYQAGFRGQQFYFMSWPLMLVHADSYWHVAKDTIS